KIVDIYNLQATVDAIGLKYSANAFLTVFTAAFTPIPYKLITITAGLFQISFFQLIVASIIGRGARFFIVALVLKLFGHKFNGMVIKYFNVLSLAAVVIVVLSFVAIKFLF
ncbi:MAG: DedA family protein, partial [Patescibacteria group bacterium]